MMMLLVSLSHSSLSGTNIAMACGHVGSHSVSVRVTARCPGCYPWGISEPRTLTIRSECTRARRSPRASL
eukprot:2417820-Rhodomonas_salina.3